MRHSQPWGDIGGRQSNLEEDKLSGEPVRLRTPLHLESLWTGFPLAELDRVCPKVCP